MDLTLELEALLDALARARIPYAVCGGVALAIHGAPRFTKDIDLLVRSDDRDAIVVLIRDLGFDLPALPMTFGVGTPKAREVQRVSKIAGGQTLTLDLLVVGPALEPVWRGREVVEWGKRRIQIVSREGLIQMKRLAGRPQDLVDIDALEAEDDAEG